MHLTATEEWIIRHRLMMYLAGMAVATFSVAAHAQLAPVYTLTRDLRIDAHTADLSPVGWLAVSRSGTIAVGQSQDHLIRFFDISGRPLSTLGREGAGPGEFRRMELAGWLGDTLWVNDGALSRFTLIAPGRTFLRNVPAAISIKARNDTTGNTMVVGAAGLYPDGSQMVEVIVSSDPSKRPAWAHDEQHTDSRLVLAMVSAQSEFKGLVSFGPRDDCGMVSTIPYRLCGHLKVGIDPAGRRLAWGTATVAGADSGTYRITLLRNDGGVIFSRKYPFVAQAIPAHIRDSLIELGRNEHGPAVPQTMMPKIAPPRVYPPLESIVVGQDGTTWVELRAVPSGNPWVILSARGDVIGTLVAPANVKLMVLGSGVVFGTEKDADDVENIVRFRLVKH